MAAPMSMEHELGSAEPSHCQINHTLDSVFHARLNKLTLSLDIVKKCKQQHEKILAEFKFLRLLIFKRNGQLRKEKSIQLLKRVQACLKRFHVGDKLFKCLWDIHQDIMSALCELTDKSDSCFLPVKQIWMFTLFLVKRYVELLTATSSYCIAAYEHLSCQLATGMLIPQMLMFMGAVSRIWLLSERIKEDLVRLYTEMYAVAEHISRAPSQWEEPSLPTALVGSSGATADDHCSHPQMLRMSAYTVPDRDKKPWISNMQNDEDRPWRSNMLNDEEDLGEPVTAPRQKFDENSNLKRDIGDSAEYKVPLKKRKKDREDIKASKKKRKAKKLMTATSREPGSDSECENEASKGENQTFVGEKQKKHGTVELEMTELEVGQPVKISSPLPDLHRTLLKSDMLINTASQTFPNKIINKKQKDKSSKIRSKKKKNEAYDLVTPSRDRSIQGEDSLVKKPRKNRQGEDSHIDQQSGKKLKKKKMKQDKKGNKNIYLQPKSKESGKEHRLQNKIKERKKKTKSKNAYQRNV